MSQSNDEDDENIWSGIKPPPITAAEYLDGKRDPVDENGDSYYPGFMNIMEENRRQKDRAEFMELGDEIIDRFFPEQNKAESPKPEPQRGIMIGTGGPKTQPKDWDRLATRGQRRANVQGAKKMTDKLNKMVSDTLRCRDAELRKVQAKKQTLAQYLAAFEKHMMESDRQWRSFVRVHVKDSSGVQALAPQYVRSVGGFMSQLQRTKGSE